MLCLFALAVHTLRFASRVMPFLCGTYPRLQATAPCSRHAHAQLSHVVKRPRGKRLALPYRTWKVLIARERGHAIGCDATVWGIS